MANKTHVEERVINGEYESAKTARYAVTRSKLHGKVKKRLYAIIDNWTLDAVPTPTVPTRAERTEEVLAANPPQRGPTHVSTDPIDRMAMLMLKYAVVHKLSMADVLLKVQQRISSISIDG